MRPEEIKDLISRYEAGLATTGDLATIEALLEKGEINIDQFQELSKLDEKVMDLHVPSPSTELDDRFYAHLALEKKKIKKNSFDSWFSFSPVFQKFAFASITFVLGLAAGYFILQRPARQTQDLSNLTEEVSNLKEMMMLSLLEKESATERLRAVSLSTEMNQASQKVTSALLKTLNGDENINVRLAALEALQPYSNDSHVRTELIQSISHQASPLVQIALADLMALLQEKSSVKEFEKLFKNENTPQEVKAKIRQRIEVLI